MGASVSTASTATNDELAATLGLTTLTCACWLEALLIEKAYREAAEELNSPWPAGRCIESSIDLRDVLQATVPRAHAAFVFGRFELRPPRFAWNHAWVAIEDGTILDLTAGQYLPDQPRESTIIVPPDHRIAECYSELEREPEWSR